jgi:hypothetical protein
VIEYEPLSSVLSTLLLLGTEAAFRKAVVDIQPDIKHSNRGGVQGRIVLSQWGKHFPLKMRVKLIGFETLSTHSWKMHNEVVIIKDQSSFERMIEGRSETNNRRISDK